MSDTFMFFSTLANEIAIIASSVLILISVLYIFPNKEMPMIDEACRYLSCCKISGILFVILACLMVSDRNKSLDMAFYQQVSDQCLCIGKQWFFFFFANIIASILISLKKNSQSSLTALNKMRASAFIMGAVFFILSFVLDVS